MKTLKAFRKTAVEMTREAFAQTYDHDARDIPTHKVLVYAFGYIECYSDGTFGVTISNFQADELTKKQAEEYLWDKFAKLESGLTSAELFNDLTPRVEKFLEKVVGDYRDLPVIERLDTVMEENKDKIGSDLYDKALYYSNELSFALQLEEKEMNVNEVEYAKVYPSDDLNIGATSALLSHHLFDKIYKSLKGKGGVMRVIEIIAEQTLSFISDHEEVERNANWDEFTQERGYSDWEEYLIATVEQKLKL